MNVYSIDIKICATAYIRADTEAEALEIAKALENDSIQMREDEDSDLPITGMGYDNPDLPNASLSPMMTCYGPWDANASPDLVAEDAPEDEDA